MAKSSHPVDVYVGSRLRLLRKKHNLTQQALAEALGISAQQVQLYEQGMNRIAASTLYDLARTLHAPVQYFYEGFQHDASGESLERVVTLSRPNRALHIALIEDDSADELLMRKALEASGKPFQLHSFRDAAAFQDFVRTMISHQGVVLLDLIILDLNLPRQDGLALLKEMKKDRYVCEVPVVILTNSIDTQQMLACYRSHASGYLIKAFDIEDFYADISALMHYWSAVILPSHQYTHCDAASQ